MKDLLLLLQVLQRQLCGAVHNADQAYYVGEDFLQRHQAGHQLVLPFLLSGLTAIPALRGWWCGGHDLLWATLGLWDGADLGHRAGWRLRGGGVREEETTTGVTGEGVRGGMDRFEGAGHWHAVSYPRTLKHRNWERLGREVKLLATSAGRWDAVSERQWQTGFHDRLLDHRRPDLSNRCHVRNVHHLPVPEVASCLHFVILVLIQRCPQDLGDKGLAGVSLAFDWSWLGR